MVHQEVTGMTDKKFYDMTPEEQMLDLKERVNRFNMLQLPGQPQGMHMGTSYLVNDLLRELEKRKDERD